MSVDWSAHTIIGCRITKEKFDNQDKLDHEDFDYLKMPSKYKNTYFTGIFGDHYSGRSDYYVGIIMSDDSAKGKFYNVININFDKIKNDVKEILDKYDLYDEADFGIWTVLSVS